jgi:hypothetical protein
VNVYDFMDKELGKAAPYGIYDIHKNAYRNRKNINPIEIKLNIK